MNLLITICARGGSKGIPGKNLMAINGIPLIAYSIKHAIEFATFHRSDIALSTDDDKIKEVALEYGLDSQYKRPDYLATDEAGKLDTINDLLKFEECVRNKKYDFILDLDVSSPLRNIDDLNFAFESLVSNPEAINLFSVNKANRNPYFNMVERQSDGFFGLVKHGKFLTRQSAPAVFDLNASFYFYRRSFFNQNYFTVINSRSIIYEMPHLCFDLDHMIDYQFIEFLFANKKLGFQI
jgi:CMP-N,N'-diacetyllegionaminic acid synthase